MSCSTSWTCIDCYRWWPCSSLIWVQKSGNQSPRGIKISLWDKFCTATGWESLKSCDLIFLIPALYTNCQSKTVTYGQSKPSVWFSQTSTVNIVCLSHQITFWIWETPIKNKQEMTIILALLEDYVGTPFATDHSLVITCEGSEN